MNKIPIIEMKNINKSFGGVHAIKNVSLNLYRGEVIGIVGHNGAGKSTLIKILSGAIQADSGEIFYNEKRVEIRNPKVAKDFGIETIYQNLALADHQDVPTNVFLGREIKTKFGLLNYRKMDIETRNMLTKLKIIIKSLNGMVLNLSGGQRQCIAVSRSVYFNAKVLIMDEPTAALGVEETKRVHELILNLKKEGIAIALISHDLHDVYELSDRILVLKNGVVVGNKKINETTKDEILSMIIAGESKK